MQLPGRAKHVPRVWPKADAHQSRSWNRGGEHARQSPVICYRAHAARSPIVTLADESACVAPRAGTRPACIQLETEQVCRDSMNLCITGARLCGFRTRRVGPGTAWGSSVSSPNTVHAPNAWTLTAHPSPVSTHDVLCTQQYNNVHATRPPSALPGWRRSDAGRREITSRWPRITLV